MNVSTIEAEVTPLQFLTKTYNLSRLGETLLGQRVTGAIDLDKAQMDIPANAQSGANALNEAIGETLKYSPSSKTWYCWNGRIYEPLSSDILPLQLIDLMSDAYVNIVDILNESRKAEIKKITSSGQEDDKIEKATKALNAKFKATVGKVGDYANQLASNKGVGDTLAKLKRVVAVQDDYFSHDEGFLVVRNGVIDLADYRATQTVTLLPHDPSRAVYRLFDAEYSPETSRDDYGTWRRFLASSIIDWDTVLLLQKAVGAAFSAEEKPRALFNLLGAPASGKSVFLSVFNRLGQGYSVMPNNQAIQLNNGDTNFYQDALRGARFVGFSEVQGKKPLDDGFLKGVLGGDQQETRRMRENPNIWKPQCVLFIASNMALKFDTRDEATFIKILPIPFPHSFTEMDPDHKMDRDLENKVMEERSGILHWVLEGMLMFWDSGLAPTAAVMAAMDGNKTANSSALTFIQALIDEEHISQEMDAPATACLPLGAAYKIFQEWAQMNGVRNVPGKQTFSSDIADFYHGKKKSGGWIFEGLMMSAEVRLKVQEGHSLSYLAQNL